MAEEDFDLLAGHDLGETRNATLGDDKDPDAQKVLVWSKLSSQGFQPSAREGHTSVANGLSVLVFGGFETGQRSNSVLALDVTSGSWRIAPTTGDTPQPRAYHAACQYQNLMLVHGGEGKELAEAGVRFEERGDTDKRSGNNGNNGDRDVKTGMQGKGAKALLAQQALLSKQPTHTTHTSLNTSMSSSTTSVVTGLQNSSALLDAHTGTGTGTGMGAGHLNGIAGGQGRGHRGQGHGGQGRGRSDGVTLGDTLAGSRGVPTVKQVRGSGGHGIPPHTTAPSAPYTTTDTTTTNITPAPSATPTERRCCLDDLHVLDTLSNEWFHVRCVLSPLPRKGHSMLLAPIAGTPHVVIFGGYSIENVTLSNSLHVCEMNMIHQHYLKKRAAKHQHTHSHGHGHSQHGKIKNLKQEQAAEPFVWRTLKTSGNPPPPRYRHSCTLIQPTLMVVFGGIGADSSVALSDLHILDLETLHWSTPNGCNALSQGVGGDGPVSGLYGHVAFSVAAMGPKPGGLNRDSTRMGFDQSEGGEGGQRELLVFGGSADPSSGQTMCNQSVFALCLQDMQWRRVPTGYSFPSARSSHSAALVQGWAPSHNNPVGLTGGAGGTGGPGTGILGASTANLNLNVSFSRGVCAIVFGGLDSIQCASDTWALDLHWRLPGVHQFDHSVRRQERSALQQGHILRGTSQLERSYLRAPGLLHGANVDLRNLLDVDMDADPDEGTEMGMGTGMGSMGGMGMGMGTGTWAGEEVPQSTPLDSFRTASGKTQSVSVEQASRRRAQQLNGRKYEQAATGGMGGMGQSQSAQQLNGDRDRDRDRNGGNSGKGRPSTAGGRSKYRDGDRHRDSDRDRNSDRYRHRDRDRDMRDREGDSGGEEVEQIAQGQGQSTGQSMGQGGQGMGQLQANESPSFSASATASAFAQVRRQHHDNQTQMQTQTREMPQTQAHVQESQMESQTRMERQTHSLPFTLTGSLEERMEVGTAFLKVRKDRAQSELALHRAREKALEMDQRLSERGERVLQLEAALEVLQGRYDADTEGYREEAGRAAAREAYLRELNEEAYSLLTMYGLRKV